MKYEIYPENTRFSFIDLDHPKLINEWRKNLSNTFIVMLETPCLIYGCESYENGKQKELLLAQTFWKGYSFGKNNSLISAIFAISSIYNFDKIYVDNLQTKLYQPI